MKKDNLIRKLLLVTGVLTLFIGYLFYILAREPEGSFISVFSQSIPFLQNFPLISLNGYLSDSLPSLLYVVSFSLICIGIWEIRSGRMFFVPLLWFFVSVVFEIGQKYFYSAGIKMPVLLENLFISRLVKNYFINGTFDQGDISAAFTGYIIVVFVLIVIRQFIVIEKNELSVPGHSNLVLIKVLVAFTGFFCLVATSPPQPPPPACTDVPVYMSYEDLRMPISSEDAREISEFGKIYVYGNLLFINEPNTGIHVIDNADPSNPINFQFLPVPGNLDIAVRSNILYADSYIDLVAFDISDVNNIQEINRIEGVFPYNPYQSVSSSLCFSYDVEEGVIVGSEVNSID